MTTFPSAQGDLDWRVSRTCESGACIMVARQDDSVVIGNTGNPGGPISEFTIEEWRQFLEGVRLGDFDDIA